jgi:6-phosphogluconolactonase (cycloisomerase 2 family)
VSLYVAVGCQLNVYDEDLDECALHPSGAGILLPAAIQYCWFHPHLPLVYVAYSDRSPQTPGTVHGVQALRLGGAARLEFYGAPLLLANRPIHLTLDNAGRYLLVAFNDPSALEVFAIDEDGAPGLPIVQEVPLDAGIFAHQVRVAPDDRMVILVTRGNDPTDLRPEDAGALKIFSMSAGRLRSVQSVAPHDGYNFGPRHLDFALDGSCLYVALERQNALARFAIDGPSLDPEPSARVSTLGAPQPTQIRQIAGAIHASPCGNFLYVANRTDTRQTFLGREIFAGGENSIAVFRIDALSEKPVLIQTIAIGGYHPRSFSIHPSGKMLVAGAAQKMTVYENEQFRAVPAGLAVFHIAQDGKLSLIRNIDVDTGQNSLFWCGFGKF